MSASPHSLSFSPRRNSVGSQRRNSVGAQLPLPTSLNASVAPRPPVGVTVSTIARPNSPTHTRGLSTASRPHQDQPPASPTISSYTPHHASSTHVGGIHPSASFFRPSRPNYPSSEFARPQPDFAARQRPDSISSFHAIPELPAESDPEPDGYPLSPLAKHHPHSQQPESDDDQRILESLNGHGDSSHEQHEPDQDPHFLSLKRMKQSREPLLPIGARPGGLGLVRPTATGGAPTSPRSNPGRMVRNSFDKVMSLSRGLSFDSIRKSTSSVRASPAGSDAGRPTFESKLSDEEHGQPHLNGHANGDPAAYSSKRPASPGLHFAKHPTLDLSLPPSRRTSSSTTSSPSPSTPSPSLFNPTPPPTSPPLSHVPILDSKGRPVRRYQLHPSRNRFYLRGRIMTGGDSPFAFAASFGLLLGLAGVWFGTTCVWWWRNESPAVVVVGAYLAGLTASSMLVTASQDPGILPRNLDPDPPYPSASPSSDSMRTPMPRDLKVRSDVVRVKYCPTCKTYRPPRSSHCKMCDNCVDGCDHHCQWVNNCVGRRNYSTFFVLLLSATTTLILIIITSALHLFFLTRRESLSFRGALSHGTGSAVAFCLAIAVIWPVGALLSYHMRLLFLNVTTIEQIRNQAHKSLVPGPPPPNPFSHGSWRRNLMAVLCRPQGYSWLNASAVATEDRREVNPGLVDVPGIWDGSTPVTVTRER